MTMNRSKLLIAVAGHVVPVLLVLALLAMGAGVAVSLATAGAVALLSGGVR